MKENKSLPKDELLARELSHRQMDICGMALNTAQLMRFALSIANSNLAIIQSNLEVLANITNKTDVGCKEVNDTQNTEESTP